MRRFILRELHQTIHMNDSVFNIILVEQRYSLHLKSSHSHINNVRAFLTHDYPGVKVLYGPAHDLRSTGRALIDQYHKLHVRWPEWLCTAAVHDVGSASAAGRDDVGARRHEIPGQQ